MYRLWGRPSPCVVCRAWGWMTGSKNHMTTRLPKRCNSTRPTGNRPQVGNPPHMITAIFHEILRAEGPGNRRQKPIVCPTAGGHLLTLILQILHEVSWAAGPLQQTTKGVCPTCQVMLTNFWHRTLASGAKLTSSENDRSLLSRLGNKSCGNHCTVTEPRASASAIVGINRRTVGDERAPQERSSEPS